MTEFCYIHIPFCLSKCKYCSFVSYTDIDLIDRYANTILKEIEIFYKHEKLKTIYFGGGTPSLLPVSIIDKIIKMFNLESNVEITFELNPDDCDLNYLKKLYDIGINRLSIGAQTFNDDILTNIGRRHNSSQIENTVLNAKKAGFSNISLDMIYGLPNQSIMTLNDDLSKYLQMEVQHISTYGLKIDNNSFWGKFLPQNLPDEDIQADMYELINDFFVNQGFLHYEISNFAKRGFESKHNLNYWNNSEYYGFGISAHGYENGVRYSNYCNFDDYFIKYNQHECSNKLTIKQKLEEEIFLGLRKAIGINVSHINAKYNINFEEKYGNILKKYKEFFIKTNYGYAFNLQGFLLSNEILVEFIE